MSIQELGKERVVMAFSDVFGQVPLDGVPVHNLVDLDTELHEQFGQGTLAPTRIGIGDWPGIARHGLVVLDSLREAQIQELAELGITPEELAELGPARVAEKYELRKHEYDTARSVSGQSLVAVANHAPRTEELRQEGQNGADFYYGRTASGLEVVGHPAFFRDLRDEGRLDPESFARIPNDAAVKAGVWKPGEQYRSRFASRLIDYPELRQPAAAHGPESPIGEDDRKHGGISYIDRFGNFIVGQRAIADAGGLIQEMEGDKVDMILTRSDGAEVAVRGLAVVRNLAGAPGNKLAVYLNPDKYSDTTPLGKGPGHIEVACRVDDPTNTTRSAYAQVARQLKENMLRFTPQQLDEIDIRFEA